MRSSLNHRVVLLVAGTPHRQPYLAGEIGLAWRGKVEQDPVNPLTTPHSVHAPRPGRCHLWYCVHLPAKPEAACDDAGHGSLVLGLQTGLISWPFQYATNAVARLGVALQPRQSPAEQCPVHSSCELFRVISRGNPPREDQWVTREARGGGLQTCVASPSLPQL